MICIGSPMPWRAMIACSFPMAGGRITEATRSGSRKRSHEFAPLESGDILRRQFEPLPVLSSDLKPTMPIRFNARRIVRVDGMHELGFFGELDLQLSLSSSCGVAPTDFVISTGSQQIHRSEYWNFNACVFSPRSNLLENWCTQ